MPPSSPSRRLTYAGYFGFILIGWNAVLIPSLIRSIEHEFHQSDAGFALLYLVSAVVYAGGAFSGGMLTERVGRRRVLPAAAICLAVGLACEALAPAWVALLIAVVPVNWGAGAIDGGINGLFLDLYREARGGALSLLHTFFSLGALPAPFVTGLLLSHGVPWRAPLLVTATLALPVVYLLARVEMPSGRIGRRERTGGEGERGRRSPLPFAGLAISIGLYVAVEIGVSSWLVRLLANAPIATATAVLSIFWGGLTLGRLLSNRIAERLDYTAYTVGCILLASLSLGAALASPWLPLTAVFFGLTGLFCGPIFPMIIALGGSLYPHRLAALSGSLAASAVVGSIVCPPLIGVMAASIGIRGGLIGAALLGVPEAGGVLLARATARPEEAPVAVQS